jgi:hydrogenase expression/formation protein HypE
MSLRKDTPRIKLEHGSGGALSRELINDLIYPHFAGSDYQELSDATPVEVEGQILLTTDTYVVDPPFFAGGDIGRLSVFGTCNDLAVSGAKPRFLSLGMVLEEGVPLADLDRVLASASTAAREAGVRIVTGDTKVVPSGKGGGIFLNTSGVGQQVFPYGISTRNIRPGDTVLVSAPIGAHGITIMAAREGLRVGEHLSSDCAFLYPLCEALFSLGSATRFIRDATRGGLAAVLNEIVSGSELGMRVIEETVPVEEEVATVSEILGLNPLEIANEGVLVAVVSEARSEEALNLLRAQPLGNRSAAIGEVTKDDPGRVVLKTRIGGHRILDFPRGLILPRIC